MAACARWLSGWAGRPRLNAQGQRRPHTDRLWDRITWELTVYLNDLAKSGAWAGPLDDEAFYVNCDAETNRPEVRESSKMVAETGLRPVAPAEFIVIRIIHWSAGVETAGP